MTGNTINGVSCDELAYHARRLHELLCEGNMLRSVGGYGFNGWTADGRAVRHRIKIEGYERTGPTVEKERAARGAK